MNVVLKIAQTTFGATMAGTGCHGCHYKSEMAELSSGVEEFKFPVWVTTTLISHLSVALFQSDGNGCFVILQSHIWRIAQRHHLFYCYISASSCGVKVILPQFSCPNSQTLVFCCVVDINKLV